MDETISGLMSKEHARIIKLLYDFETAFQEDFAYGFPQSKELFNCFKWNLEKHFFVEEKAIFEMSEKISGEGVSDTFELMKEHGEMIELMNDIEDGLDENVRADASKLKNLLRKHHIFEDDTFYPSLDDMLSPKQKHELSERIREIVRG